MSKKKKKLNLFIILVIAAVVIFITLYSTGIIFSKNVSIPDDQLYSANRDNLEKLVVATGSIVPRSTIEIKSKASGIVEKIMVEEGETVTAGQVLLELDKELVRAQLREAEANLLAIEAALQEAGSNQVMAERTKDKLEMDQMNLQDKVNYNQKQVARYQQLFEEKLLPLNDMDQAERGLQDSTFQLGAIKSELLMQDAEIEAAQKAVLKAEAEVTQAVATVDRARENLHYATIRAPLRATVLKRHIEEGDAVSSILQMGSQATLIMTLGDMEEVYFEGRVDESDIGQVFEGMKSRIRVDAYRDKNFPGQVMEISPLGEEEENVIGFETRVSVDEEYDILRAQMSANAEIIIETRKDILLIKENAISYDEDRNSFVLLYDPAEETMMRKVPVEIGLSNGTLTEIVSGLKDGDKVVILINQGDQ
ncbi:MAG: efflux RND transporter periplasmic adaptor subunit [Acidobacteriota bacterium]